MKSITLKRITAFAITATFLLCITFDLSAQDRRRRIKPAFPIGAGEEMMQWTGLEINASNQWQTSNNGWTRSSAGTQTRIIKLPVGTTLKRMLGDFVDQDAAAGKDITVELVSQSL